MLHYKGVITDQSGIKAKPIGNTDKNLMENYCFMMMSSVMKNLVF